MPQIKQQLAIEISCSVLNLSSFILNYFVLTSNHTLYRTNFILKVIFWFLLVVIYLAKYYLYIMGRPKIKELLNKISLIYPFLELLVFINIELQIYKNNKTLDWISFLRPISLCLPFFLKNKSNEEKGVYKYLVFSMTLGILLINLLLIIDLLSYFELILIFIESILLMVTYFGYSYDKQTKNFVQSLLVSPNTKGGREVKKPSINPNYQKETIKEILSMEVYFDYVHDGVIVLLKDKKTVNYIKVEIFNKKASNLLQCSEKKPSFEFLDLIFYDFYLVKVKCKKNDKTLKNINRFDADPNLLIRMQEKFKSLSSILDFYDQMVQNNEILHFERRIKNNSYQKLTHNLKLMIRKKFIDNNAYYFIIIQKTDRIIQLNEKNQITTRLLNSLTHELKTPLNGSIPLLEFLNNDSSVSQSIKTPFIENSLNCLKLLDNSLNNILDYSLMLSDQFGMSLSSVILKELLVDVFSIIKHLMRSKKLELIIDSDNFIMNQTIITDYNRSKQLLLNIILNSIQFTLEGRITLKITKPMINSFHFEVQDTGVGFQTEELKKLKRKLSFCRDEIQLNSTGSCMALTISNKIALILGKCPLEIISEVSKGCVVKFTILDQKDHKKFNSLQILQSPKLNFDKFRVITLKKMEEIQEFSQRILEKKNSRKELFRSSSGKHLFISKESAYSNKTENFEINSFQIQEKLQIYDFETLLNKNCKNDEEFNLLNKIGDHEKLRSEESLFREKDNYFFNKNIQKPKVNFLNSIKEEALKKESMRSFDSLSKFEESEQEFMEDMGKSKLKIQHASSSLKKESTNEIVIEITKNKKILDCEEILIVDDDIFNVFALELIFKSFNLKCKKAFNGREALEIIKNSQELKLVLMDYQMPIMDGVECTKEVIKLIEKKEINDIPIIGCTAFTTKDEINKCIDSGMKDIIFKPVSKRCLANIVKEWYIA